MGGVEERMCRVSPGPPEGGKGCEEEGAILIQAGPASAHSAAIESSGGGAGCAKWCIKKINLAAVMAACGWLGGERRHQSGLLQRSREEAGEPAQQPAMCLSQGRREWVDKPSRS